MTDKITPAQIKAVGNYERKNYDKMLIRIPKGEREAIKAAAARAGSSLNAYIVQAIREKMERGESK